MKCDHLCHNFWFQQVDHHGWATENGESDREHGVIVQLSLKKPFAENKAHRANHVLYTELTYIGRLDLRRDMTYDGINDIWMTYTCIWS